VQAVEGSSSSDDEVPASSLSITLLVGHGRVPCSVALALLSACHCGCVQGNGEAKLHRHRRHSGVGAGGYVSSYFQHQNVTGSTRTLADLQLDASAPGQAEGMRDLLSALPQRHPAEKAELLRRQQSQFAGWWAHLRAGNSVLLYGYGSKHDLLNTFAREHTRDGACLAVNGMQPSLSAKQVLWQQGATAAHCDRALCQQPAGQQSIAEQ
jgi:hypothetical protein